MPKLIITLYLRKFNKNLLIILISNDKMINAASNKAEKDRTLTTRSCWILLCVYCIPRVYTI